MENAAEQHPETQVPMPGAGEQPTDPKTSPFELRKESDGSVTCRLTSLFRPAITTQFSGAHGDGFQEDEKYLLVQFRGIVGEWKDC